MAFLAALLAFAAIMVLLSTIIAVVIEGYVKFRGLRTKSLQTVLENFYLEAVTVRAPAAARLPKTRAAAREFANQMMDNPSAAPRPGKRKNKARKRFNALTIRQLVEQLARTAAGKAFLTEPDERQRAQLNALAYEYDRFRDAARDTFARNVRGASVWFAFLMAITFNIDAVRMFRALSVNPQAQALAIEFAENNQNLGQFTQNGDAPRPTGEDIENTIDDVSELVSRLAVLNLPVGISQYPYCSPYSPILGEVKPGNANFDLRCQDVSDALVKSGLWTQNADGEIVTKNWFDRPRMEKLDAVRAHVAARWDPALLSWLIAILISGGMIGLGTPFWANVYRRLALLVPIAGAASKAARGGDRPRTAADGTAQLAGRRDDPEIRNPDELVFALRTAAGQSPDPHLFASSDEGAAPTTGGASTISGGQANLTAPPGQHVGRGSTQRVGDAAHHPSGETAHGGFRRLRG